MDEQMSGQQTRMRERRRFLRTAAGTVIMVATPLRIAVGDTGKAAPIFGELSVLGPAQAQVLLGLARTLFPHSFLTDEIYAAAVAQLDSAAVRSPLRAAQIRDALEQLPQNFSELDVREREKILAELDGGPFFKFARQTTITAVYRNPDVWRHFGYPGPSLEFGGWVNRELVDIDWFAPEKS